MEFLSPYFLSQKGVDICYININANLRILWFDSLFYHQIENHGDLSRPSLLQQTSILLGIWNLISCYFLLFVRNLFNFIARVWVNCFARVWFNFFDSVNCFARNYTLIFLVFIVSNLTIFLTIFLSTIFFFCGVIISLLRLMFVTFYKCKFLSSGYATCLSGSLKQPQDGI